MISFGAQKFISKGVFANVCRVFSMASEKLASIPAVEIDDDGTFKYVLIKVYGPETEDGSEPFKMLVRGFKWGEYHSDIYDVTADKVKKLGLDSECVGGGRIQHEAAAKKLKVYGYSQGYGKADHSLAVELLKKVYDSYIITHTDEGY